MAINEEKIGLEKPLQTIIENNLESVLGVKFIKTEMAIEDCEFDTVAWDPYRNAFAIIEFKPDKNTSVADQGLKYYFVAQQHKEALILEYQKIFGPLKKKVDWSQTRIIFVAHDYTEYQKSLTYLPWAELWQVKKYAGGLIELRKLAARSGKGISIPNMFPKQKIEKEIKIYTEDLVIREKWASTFELYQEFKQAVFNAFPGAEARATKLYIAFDDENRKTIVEALQQKNNLNISLRGKIGQFKNTPLKLIEKNMGHWMNGDTEVRITNSSQIPAVIELIRQTRI